MSGKYALIIGNTEYIDSGLAQLTAPGKDAEDFARVLKDKEIGAFDDVRVVVNEPSASVIEAIDEFFDQKKPDDLLVLYFSGHGIRDEIGSLYLAFKNTIRSRLRSTAIKSDYIREAMDQSRSKRQVLILDCCNSGAFPQGIKAGLGGAMGMTQAFQGYGRFVLTASDATQFAWEGDKVIGETDNSLFTHFLVQGLEGEADSDGDGRISVDELYDYAYHQISRVTPKQTPTKSASKQEGEIILRENMRLEDIKPVALPTALLDSIENPFPDIRLGAVQQLSKLLNGKNLGLARSAQEALERIAEEDDSRQVLRTAMQALESVRQAEQLSRQKAEEESLISAKHPVKLIADDKRSIEEPEETEPKKNTKLQSLEKQNFAEVPYVTKSERSARQMSVPKERVGAIDKSIQPKQSHNFLKQAGFFKSILYTKWGSISIITFGWLAAFAIGFRSIYHWISAIGSEKGYMISGAIAGMIGGLVTIVILNGFTPSGWKSKIFIALMPIIGFAVGAGVSYQYLERIYYTIARSLFPTDLGVAGAFTFFIVGAITGGVGGLSIAVAFRINKIISSWRKILLITMAWAIGFAISAGMGYLLSFYRYQQLINIVNRDPISLAIGGAIGGLTTMLLIRNELRDYKDYKHI